MGAASLDSGEYARKGWVKSQGVAIQMSTTILNESFSIVAPGGGDTDWCSGITYNEVDMCHVRAYLARNRLRGCCLPSAFFFGLPPGQCGKGAFPIPTDEGLPKSLPILPLGFHYGQISTDSPHGRALAGIWAKDQGNIFIVPWIQSTERVKVSWEGVKDRFADADPVEDNPIYQKAIAEYARWQHYDKWEKDEAEAARAKTAFEDARTMLIRRCREETRVRNCEPRLARSSPGALFYNDEQSATATCPSGQTGTPITQVIPAGTVASNKSVADANAQAKTLAQEQAQARLDCVASPVTYLSAPASYTAHCSHDEGAPQPDGNPVTINLPAGAVTSTESQAIADAAAQALAQQQAEDGLACTWWNAEQPYTAVCESDSGENVTKTTPPHTYSSTLSQADADTQAINAAKLAAEDEMTCPELPVVYKNTIQTGILSNRTGCGAHGPVYSGGILVTPADPGCTVSVIVSVKANFFSSTVSQNAANQAARDYGQNWANLKSAQKCALKECGSFDFEIPG